MKQLFTFILIFHLAICSTSLFGQFVPHKLQTGKDLAILGGGTAGMVLTIPLHKKLQALTDKELALLNAGKILKFDQYPTSNYSRSAQKLSDRLLYSSAVAPFTLLGSDRVRNDLGTYGVMYLETALVNSAITSLTKNLVKRTRPYAYNPDVDLMKKKSKSTRVSFFSGHTSSTAAMYFFTAQVYSDLHPDSDFKPMVWTTAALIPAITGYLRVKGGKHFPTDVVVGYVVGSLIGILIPRIHRSVL